MYCTVFGTDSLEGQGIRVIKLCLWGVGVEMPVGLCDATIMNGIL